MKFSRAVLVFCLLLFSGIAFAQTYSGMSVGQYGNLNGFRPFPGSAWDTVVTYSAVDPTSAAWVTEVSGNHLHPDMSIPYQVVDSSVTPYVYPTCTGYCDESDLSAAPLPASVLIEGSPADCPTDGNDRHGLFPDRATGYVYEYYQLTPCKGAYSYTSSALWDMTINEARPYTFTSTDAAGLSVFAGLAKYEEATTQTVAQRLPDGTVVQTLGHAIRFTMAHTRCVSYISGSCQGGFVAPATHAAGNNSGTNNIMGMRIRLKSSYNTSALTGASLVMANTMKTYGMILADNGSNMFFTGTSDPRWSSDDQNQLKAIDASNFEVIQLGTVYTNSTVPTGAAPKVSTPVANPATVASGSCSKITWTSSGESYDYLQVGPPSRTQSTTVCPATTTSYVLQSSNAYGRTASSAVKVTVQAAGTGTGTGTGSGSGSGTGNGSGSGKNPRNPTKHNLR